MIRQKLNVDATDELHQSPQGTWRETSTSTFDTLP